MTSVLSSLLSSLSVLAPLPWKGRYGRVLPGDPLLQEVPLWGAADMPVIADVTDEWVALRTSQMAACGDNRALLQTLFADW